MKKNYKNYLYYIQLILNKIDQNNFYYFFVVPKESLTIYILIFDIITCCDFEFEKKQLIKIDDILFKK